MSALQLGNYNWLTEYHLFVNLPCPFCNPCSQYPSNILLAIIIIMCRSLITHNYADSMEIIGSLFELSNTESFMSKCVCAFINSDRLQLEVWLFVRKLTQSDVYFWGNSKLFTIKEWGVKVERNGCNHQVHSKLVVISNVYSSAK